MRRIDYRFSTPRPACRWVTVVGVTLWLTLLTVQQVLATTEPEAIWSEQLADALGGQSSDHLPITYNFDRTVVVPEVRPGGRFFIAGGRSGTETIDADDRLDIVLEDASAPAWEWHHNFDSADGYSTVPIPPVPVRALQGLVRVHISLTDLRPPLFGISTGLFLVFLAPVLPSPTPIVRSTPTAIAQSVVSSPPAATAPATVAPAGATPVLSPSAMGAVPEEPTDEPPADITPISAVMIDGPHGMSWRERGGLVFGTFLVCAVLLTVGWRLRTAVGEASHRVLIHTRGSHGDSSD